MHHGVTIFWDFMLVVSPFSSAVNHICCSSCAGLTWLAVSWTAPQTQLCPTCRLELHTSSPCHLSVRVRTWNISLISSLQLFNLQKRKEMIGFTCETLQHSTCSFSLHVSPGKIFCDWIKTANYLPVAAHICTHSSRNRCLLIDL